MKLAELYRWWYCEAARRKWCTTPYVATREAILAEHADAEAVPGSLEVREPREAGDPPGADLSGIAGTR